MPTFPTPAPISVTLDLLAADVRIRAGEHAETTVAVGPRDPAEPEDVKAAEGTRVEFADGRLEIRAPRPWRRFSPRYSGGAIEVEITLPAGSDVHGESSIADVRTDGTLGTCHFTTSAGDLVVDRTAAATLSTSGRVTLGRADGPARIKAAGAVRIGEAGGSTTVENLNGATRIGVVSGGLRCRAANGDVTVDTALGDVEATTANGDLRVDDVVRGDVSLETAYGRIEIGIRPGTAARLDVHSRYGRVRNSLTAADGPEGSAETATVRARTSFGDVVVRRPEQITQD